ncbi:MAG TPA: metal ABC transporter permease [Acidimicrobiales bacterium]|nr:metal ABC transporter permease [Acidimicrobiales bacterium]
MSALAATTTGWSWNPASDVSQLFTYPFMVNALLAGTIVAVTAAVVGWFMVLRRQTFAGHTLAVIAFPGAAGATLIGVAASLGYFAFAVGGALIVAAVPGSGTSRRGFTEESAVIGTLQAFALAAGFLFVALYKGFLNGVNALLFGTFLGITTAQVWTLFVVGIAALAVLGLIGRPLLFATVDPDVAAARGVRVRLLSVVFLVVLGVAVAEASQITGSLLVFALLVMPAATAQRFTVRPVLGLALSVLIALIVTWLGLVVSYYSPYPMGFYLTSFAFGLYLVSFVVRYVLDRRRRLPPVTLSARIAT